MLTGEGHPLANDCGDGRVARIGGAGNLKTWLSSTAVLGSRETEPGTFVSASLAWTLDLWCRDETEPLDLEHGEHSMRTGWLGVSAVTVVGLGLWSVPEPPEQHGDLGAVCAAADPVAWFAENVDPATLTYEKFLEYSPAERAVVTRRVNEKRRSMLRREHLARAARDDRFSREQKAVIERVRAWHERHVTDQAPLAAGDLDAAVSQLFSREEAWLAFRLLGSSDLTATSTSPAGVVSSVEGDQFGWCTCRWITDCADDPDDPDLQCEIPPLPWLCIPRPRCGPFDLFWCWGKCRDIISETEG